jgi:outer membrane protein assembly factor BamB
MTAKSIFMGLLPAAGLVSGMISPLTVMGDENTTVSARGDVWNQWRGPGRNGVAPQSPPLVDSWPEAGPKRVWISEEKIPSAQRGGHGSVVVAQGKVYLLVTPRHKERIETRTLSERSLKSLGWQKNMPPGDILEKIEQARLSEERTRVKLGKEVRAWAAKWVEANLDKTQQKSYGWLAQDRLYRGSKAADLKLLEKLSSVLNREFAGQAELDAWLAENKIEGEEKKLALSRFPDRVEKGEDIIYCLDAATGKTLWKTAFPGVAHPNGSSSTPCVADGRVYVIGSGGDVYCVDAVTGKDIWKDKIGTGAHCSFIVVNGIAVIPAGPMTGFNAKTGEVAWKQEEIEYTHSSPVVWQKDGKAYIICRAKRKTFCLNPADGKIVWSFNGGGASTPAVAGHLMAIWARYGGLHLYRLSPEKAERLWYVKCPPDPGASPLIHEGHVYAAGSRVNICVNVETGQTAWQEKLGTSAYTSPVVADGKMFVAGKGGTLVMLEASAEKGEVLGKAELGLTACTSAAFADGLLYLRLKNNVACYDLRK